MFGLDAGSGVEDFSVEVYLDTQGLMLFQY